MKYLIFTFATIISLNCKSQTFLRSELTTSLSTPWEITYGQDNYLWLTESGGRVSRIDPTVGTKTVVYTAADYFGGSAMEQSTLCFQPNIGAGTLGLTLHPDFPNVNSSYIYFVYSYNNGTVSAPDTKFKIVRLTWDVGSSSVIANTDLVTQLPNGYDHLGGRLLSVKQGTNCYLFMSCGDNGISEENSPTCYSNQANNPNNFTQDVNYKNGKIHRFNIDGTIPADNPIPGNSFYTRGHRNPQGLAYNTSQNVLYDIEHGDRTDDEINVLVSGMNYGWKNVKGYHADNNFPGESAYISGYTPHPSIVGDALKEPMYSWCATSQPTVSNYLDWCTVAPSGAAYYSSNAIPNWNNSLLVTTLKNGTTTDQEVYRFKLNANGLGIAPSTTTNPNPERYFGNDQALNGRLRDIAISPDGTKIYLINNGGASSDKITVYTYDASGINDINAFFSKIKLYPNPAENSIQIDTDLLIEKVEIINQLGQSIQVRNSENKNLDVSMLNPGVYTVKIFFKETNIACSKKIVKL